MTKFDESEVNWTFVALTNVRSSNARCAGHSRGRLGLMRFYSNLGFKVMVGGSPHVMGLRSLSPPLRSYLNYAINSVTIVYGLVIATGCTTTVHHSLLHTWLMWSRFSCVWVTKFTDQVEWIFLLVSIGKLPTVSETLNNCQVLRNEVNNKLTDANTLKSEGIHINSQENSTFH